MKTLRLSACLPVLALLLLACDEAPTKTEEDPILIPASLELEELYKAAEADKGANRLDAAKAKFAQVVTDDSLNCFANAFFHLADIYWKQNLADSAVAILTQGRDRYAAISNACASEDVARFKKYIAKNAPDGDLFGTTFIAYDEAPAPIGGFTAIQRELIIPEDARKAGFDGRINVNVRVGCDGHACATAVRSGGDPRFPSLDAAARLAIKSVAWTPAKQRGTPVSGVWISVPVVIKTSSN
jgi:hypothetical protein